MTDYQFGKLKVRVLQGDLTEQDTDALVNAANNDLQLGAGVAGAIARRGGPTIQEECDRIGAIRVGEAAITGGGNLRANYVVHAASMHLGGRTTRETLKTAMDQVFRLARERGFQSLAIPAVGTGVARLPVEECAGVMLECLRSAAATEGSLREVRFVLFDEGTRAAFDRALQPASDQR